MADEVIITNVGADVSVTSVGSPVVEIMTTEQAQLVIETVQIQGPPGPIPIHVGPTPPENGSLIWIPTP